MSYQQIVYDRLRQHGMTEAGALGVLGNFECESNCEPFRVQGDFSSFRSISKAYVNALNSGRLTKEVFAKDQKGFGLAQWTFHTRKAELYDEWKRSGKRIDDAEFQTDFAVMELKRDFAADYKLLCSTNDIYEAVRAVCDRFENPAIKNYSARFQAACKIKHEIDLNAWQSGCITASEDIEQIPDTEYWPPRVICNGMTGADVEVLQSVLKARGLIVQNADGIFGSFLEEKVKAFQTAHNLDVDGIVGPKTWKQLLEM